MIASLFTPVERAADGLVRLCGLDPAQVFPLFRAIQSAFYAEGRDVTRSAVLAELVAGLGVDAARFLAAFASDEARARTQAHFRQTRVAGVRGFPALILQQDTQLHPVSSGCESLEAVQGTLDAHLSPR